jgi:multidrug efflux pump subunit AcrA (membrane-fusion protein)
MGTKLGPLYLWQALVLAAVFVAAIGGALVGLDLRDDEGGASLADGEQLVPAQIGDLINVVSTDGSLSFPNVETARFESRGTVGDVLVEEGDTIRLGDVLATLDAASVVDLQNRAARAEVTLREAEEDLAEATGAADPLDVAKAESAVAKAILSLQNEKDDLTDMTAGPSADDLADAQAVIDAATTELANAQTNLAIVTRDWDDRQDTSRTAVSDAVNAYDDIFDFWLGVSASTIDDTLDPGAVLASLGADLDALFDGGTEPPNLALSLTPPGDDPATVWNESVIYSWLTFFPGEIVGDCGDSGAPFQGACVSSDLDAEWAALDDVRDALETTEFDADKAVAAAGTSLSKTEDTLESARTALDDLTLAADPLAVEVAVADIAVAVENLASAESALVDLAAEPDARDLAVLVTELAAAELALEDAAAELLGVTLTAPISGVVTDVSIETGQNATSQQATVTIVDQTVVVLEGTVDEIDVLSIAVGDPTSVELSALPGQALAGTVTEIGTPTNQQGVVTFPVTVMLVVPDGLELLEGLSATASVIINQQLGVLRVPTAAIQGSFVQPFVRVVNGGGIEERLVELGSSDDFWVVVTAGLTEGEEVAMPAPSSGDIGFGNFAGFGGAEFQALRQLQGGGGFGGGRGGGGGGGGGQGGAGQRGN